jgi:hypothetical protein
MCQALFHLVCGLVKWTVGHVRCQDRGRHSKNTGRGSLPFQLDRGAIPTVASSSGFASMVTRVLEEEW